MACTRGPIVDQRYLHDLKGARRELASIIQRKNAAPLLLRLAFHDAGNYNAMNNTGGVNGSIRIRQELNQAPNNGIHDGVKICEEVKKKHPLVTYADIIQLAGILSVELSGGPAINFVPGRADTNVADQLNIPNPRGGADHLRRTFYQMGLSDKDIVALSGAHTLGRARRENSGFDGPFTRNTLKFDNSYYVELMRGETPGLVKFPTDKALMQDPVFRQFVELYARNEGAFFRDYAESHKKMSELGFVPQNMFGDGCGTQAETDCCETQNYNNYDNNYNNNNNYDNSNYNNNNYDCCPGGYQNRGSACY